MQIGDKIIIKYNNRYGTISGSEVIAGKGKRWQVRFDDNGKHEYFGESELKKR